MAPWGSQTRFSTVADGLFHCPRCGVDRTFELRRARRWLTLAGAPMVPRRRLGAVVECTTCTSRFDERVRAALTDAGFAERLSLALRAVAVAVATVGGAPSPATRRAVVGVVGARVAHAYDATDLDTDLVTLAGRRPEEFLSGLRGLLNEAGREQLVRAALEIARADGGASAAALDVAGAAGTALGMTAARVDTVIASAGGRVP